MSVIVLIIIFYPVGVELDHPETIHAAVEDQRISGGLVCKMLNNWSKKEGKNLRALFDIHPEDREKFRRAAGNLFRVRLDQSNPL